VDQDFASATTCSLASAELTAILYALEHGMDTLRKTAHIYVATTSRDALSAIEKRHSVGVGGKWCPRSRMPSMKSRESVIE
jgi:hypothetical protein